MGPAFLSNSEKVALEEYAAAAAASPPLMSKPATNSLAEFPATPGLNDYDYSSSDAGSCRPKNCTNFSRHPQVFRFIFLGHQMRVGMKPPGCWLRPHLPRLSHPSSFPDCLKEE